MCGMTTVLKSQAIDEIVFSLQQANVRFLRENPGSGPQRQPVHTVYGGAHLFRADSARRLGDLALRSVQEFAPEFCAFARAIGLPGGDSLPRDPQQIQPLVSRLTKTLDGATDLQRLAYLVHQRVINKLQTEPVEDFRIDFEDGYGTRSDADEDACAQAAAHEVAKGMKQRTLPPFIGIRIKPFGADTHQRAIRTLDLFLSTLSSESNGQLPEHFVVTLPKVVIPEQVAALSQMFEVIESRNLFPRDSLRLEIMVETTQSILDADGRSALPALVKAAGGRCLAAHFGVYDYTASCHITAQHQGMTHPACDFARHMMQVALTGTGIWLSDGATNIMPVAPHRAGAASSPPLTQAQIRENNEGIHRGWRLHFDQVRHSLRHAFYQGWDLHPAQLPTRYAAVYSFFLESLPAASERLRNFVEKAALATLSGDVFDDAATGQGLLNFFLRGLNCGAITEQEALQTGLTIDELRSRSFMKIMANRRAH